MEKKINQQPSRAGIWTSLLVSLGVVCAPALAATHVLDWDGTTWPPGDLTRTIISGSDDVTFNVLGGTAGLIPLSGTDSPHLNATLTGGLPPENSLYVRTDHASGGVDEITITIDFSHGGGVSNVSFSVFDVDHTLGNHVDELKIFAQTTGGPASPSSVTTGVCNNFDGISTVTGTCSAPDTSSAGTTTVVFNQSGISRITLIYRNAIPQPEPGIQEISIHDITFEAPLVLVKRSFQSDGTPIPGNSTLPIGTRVKFLIYVNNPGLAVNDVSLRDVLDPLFGYAAGSIRFDSSVPACPGKRCTPAEEAAIFAAVDAGTVGTDVVDADVVSVAGPIIDAGNENVGNAPIDIPAGRVWAVIFSVLLQ